MSVEALRAFLDRKVADYDLPEFIAADPVQIPHMFTGLQDREISGLFAAILAWGSRTTVINNCTRLLGWMDNAPHQFILDHTDADLKPFLAFVHRTFNATDLLYFLHRLQLHYLEHESLESAFVPSDDYTDADTGAALIRFHQRFFSVPHPDRTRKHIASPASGSACKRLNMYLRWMVRRDAAGVDFGIWNKIAPSQLICPLDVHVARVAARLGMIDSDKADWKTAVALTEALRELDPLDPVKYDFALFGLGMAERF